MTRGTASTGWRGASASSGGFNVARPGALGILLDLELDLLAAGEPVEVERPGERAAVEEVFLAVVGSDEPEAALGDKLLDSSGGHGTPPRFSNEGGVPAVSSRRNDRTRVATECDAGEAYHPRAPFRRLRSRPHGSPPS